MLLVTLECINFLIWYLTTTYIEDKKGEEAFV
jgi:hypothetical protein